MASQPKKKSHLKLIAATVIIIIATSLAAGTSQYLLSQPKKPNNTKPSAMTLTLIGSNGQQQNLTQNDIMALQSCSGQGGFIKSGGEISSVGTYTGVPVVELLNLVGGMTSDETLTVLASDGYTMTYTYNQVVNGQDFPTFDPNNKKPNHRHATHTASFNL